MQESISGIVNKDELKSWKQNVISWLYIPVTVYVGSVLAITQVPGHALSFADFIPTPIVMSAITTYVGISVMNYMKKYYQGT